MQPKMTHRPKLAEWFRSRLARSRVVLGGVIVAMAGGLPAQDFDLGIQTDKAAYAPGDNFTATVGLTTRAPGVQGWQYGVKHDPGLLTLETLTFDGTDAQGAWLGPRAGLVQNFIAGDGGVGFTQAVVLDFFGVATVPTDQEFFSLLFVEYTVSTDACPAIGAGNVATAMEFTEELGQPDFPAVEINVTAGHVPVDVNVISTNAVIGCQEAPAFRRGDANADGNRNLIDAVFILERLFGGGDEPPCVKSADANDNGTINLTDAVYLLNFLFGGGAPPTAPFAECGQDPTADDLSCESFPSC